MSLLNQVTKDDLNGGEIYFNKGDVIEFACIDSREDAVKGHIYMDCKIESGEYKGKNYTVAIFSSEHPVAKKHIADFIFNSGFWTEEELNTSKDLPINKLRGTTFQGKATEAREGKNGGRKFQSIQNIRCLSQAPTQTLPVQTNQVAVDGVPVPQTQVPPSAVSPQQGVPSNPSF